MLNITSIVDTRPFVYKANQRTGFYIELTLKIFLLIIQESFLLLSLSVVSVASSGIYITGLCNLKEK